MIRALAVLLALWSLLNWTEFDVVRLWQLSVLSREFGHWLAAAALLLAVHVWRRRYLYPRGARRGAILFAAVAAIGFARPVVSAFRHEAEFRAELAAMGERFVAAAGGMRPAGAADVPALFSLAELWKMPWASAPSRRIEYAGPDGGRLHADYYPATTGTRPPLVVVVHGGGWEGGDTRQLPALNAELARAGYAVASVSYRFSPAAPWPGQLEDVVAGIRELRARADELGFDPERLLLLGRSAGAQIAGVIAYSRTDLPVRGYVNFYGPTDLDFGFEITVEGDIIDSRNILRRFLSGDPVQAAAAYRSSSVIEAAKLRPVPTLLLYGTDDRLVWHKHGERLRRRLLQNGTPAALLDLPWGVHGFDFNPAGPGGQISRNAILYFAGLVL